MMIFSRLWADSQRNLYTFPIACITLSLTSPGLKPRLINFCRILEMRAMILITDSFSTFSVFITNKIIQSQQQKCRGVAFMKMVVLRSRKNEGKLWIEMEKVEVEYRGNRYCLLIHFPHHLAGMPYFKEMLALAEGVEGYVVRFKDLPFLARILKDENLCLDNLPLESKEIFQEIASSKSVAKCIIDTLGPWRLRPHQMSAIDFFFRHGGKIILGDGWNMGKTVTTLAIMFTSRLKLFLVVCDATLVYHWKKHMIESSIWKEEEIITEPKEGSIVEGCAIITFEVFVSKRFKFDRLRFVVFDEPQTEISYQQFIRTIEYVVVISRNGNSRFHELLPMVLPKAKSAYLKQRYSIDEKGPKAHYEELKAIKAHFIIAEERVNLRKTAIPFKAVYLKPNYTNFLEQIAAYIRHGIRKNLEEYILHCRDEKTKHFFASYLSSLLNQEELGFIKYKDSLELIQESPIQYTVLFPQPFQIQEEETLNKIVKHLQANNCKAQYFPYPHEGQPSLYPERISIQQYIDAPSRSIFSFKPSASQDNRKIIVYYDYEQPEEQLSLVEDDPVENNYNKQKFCFKDGCYSLDMQIFICQKNENNPQKEKEIKQDSPQKNIEKQQIVIDLDDEPKSTLPTQQKQQQPQIIEKATKKRPLQPLKYKHKQRSVIKIKVHPLTSNFP